MKEKESYVSTRPPEIIYCDSILSLKKELISNTVISLFVLIGW